MCQPRCLLTFPSPCVYSGRGGYHLGNNVLMPVLALLNSLLPPHAPFGKGTILTLAKLHTQIKSWHKSVSHYKWLLADIYTEQQ